jgi:uncharacterized membrane protein YfcA
LLAKLYAVFLLYEAVGYLNVPALWRKKKSADEIALEDKPLSRNLFFFIAIGLLAGVIAGMFGKGGGIVIVPLLVKFFKYETKAATATSLAALQLPVGLPSVLVYAEQGCLNWVYAALMALGLLIGAFFGTKLALKLPSAIFKKIYAVFLLVVAAYMLYKYF